MNDPEKLHLLCQCLDEILHFVRTFEFPCKKKKTKFIQYFYQKYGPKLSMYF